MKTRSFNKKLNFTKATVAHLNPRELEHVVGGLSGDTCPLPCFPSVELTCNCPTQCTSYQVCSC